MKKISIVLIDDHDDDRWTTKNFLTQNGILVTGSFTHNQFLKQSKLESDPGIFIISFDTPQFLTELTIGFVQKHFPLAKRLINSSIKNRNALDKIIKMGIDGLIFKTHRNPESMLNALNSLHENNEFFLGP